MANSGAKQALTQKPKKQSQRRKAVGRKKQNDRLERIRLLYISYEHYRDSLIQQHDFHMTVVAAHKSLDLIELATKAMVRLLPRFKRWPWHTLRTITMFRELSNRASKSERCRKLPRG